MKSIFKKILCVLFVALTAILCAACSAPGADSDTVKTAGVTVDMTVTESITETEGTVLQTETGFDTIAPAAEPVCFSWENGDVTVIRAFSWGPRVYTTSDGALIAGYETSEGIKTMISADHGKTWDHEAQASFRPDKTCANVNFFEYGGILYLAYRATGDQDDGFYTSLQVSCSEDLGKSWRRHSTVCEYLEKRHSFKGVWEPYLGVIDGALVCFYANDSTKVTSRQNIESLTWNGTEWTDRQIISKGVKHKSRDGMPVWISLSGGGYALVIESSRYADSGHPFVLQLLYSEDGKTWSEPADVYIPTAYGSKAGAPGIAELPTGQIVISFQTDEDATVKGDTTSIMKSIISDGTAVSELTAGNFSPSDSVFGTPDGESSIWSGIHYHGGYLYAAAGTKYGSSLNVIRLSDGVQR